jgi:outer membrane protein assembly factor BamB
VTLVVAALVAAGCGGDTSNDATDDPENPPTTNVSVDPPATDPPATDPPATDPPATDPPATDPVTTEAPSPPASDAATPDVPVAPSTGVVSEFAGELVWSIERPISSGSPFVVGIGAETVALSTFAGPLQPVTAVGVDRSTGEVRWTYDRAPASSTVETVLDDTIVVVDEAALPDAGPGDPVQLTALDLATGEEVWSAGGIDAFAPWLVVDGTILAFSGRRIVALDPATGDERWAYLPSGAEPGEPRVALRLVVVRNSGLVLLALVDGDASLVGLGLDGAERWQLPISEPPRVDVTDVLPDASNDVVAVPRDGVLAGVDLATGEIRWTSDELGDDSVEFTLRSDPSGVAMVCGIVDGSIVIGGFDLADGTLRWSKQIEPTGQGFEGSAVVGYVAGAVLTTSSQATPASCEPSGAPFGDVTVSSMLDGSTIWSVSAGEAALSSTGLGSSGSVSADPAVVGTPGIVERGGDVWTRYDAASGSVIASGTLGPGSRPVARGPFVAVIADTDTVLGVSGAAPVGEIDGLPGWDDQQVYFWSVDGVLSAVR